MSPILTLALAAVASAQEAPPDDPPAPAADEAPAGDEAPAEGSDRDPEAAPGPEEATPADEAPPAETAPPPSSTGGLAVPAPAGVPAPSDPPPEVPPDTPDRDSIRWSGGPVPTDGAADRDRDSIRWSGRERVDTTGDALAYGWSAALGGYMGGSLGYVVAEDNGSVVAGALIGGVVGPATLAVVKGKDHISVDQAVLLGTTSTLGAYTGLQAARSFIPPLSPGEDERIVLSGVLGSVAGTGIAVALLPSAPAQEHMWMLDLGALIGWNAAAGTSSLFELDAWEDRQIRAPLALASAYALGGLSLGMSAAGAQMPSPSLLVLSLGHGAWIGGWMPYMATNDPGGKHFWGGLRLGLGVGYGAALALGPLVEPGARSTALQMVGIAAGSALGAGIPMAAGADFSSEAPWVVGPMLASGVAGQLLGGVVSPYYDLSRDDAVLLSVLGTWVGYQAVGWGYFGSHLDGVNDEAVGYALTTAGAGTLVAAGMAPFIEVNPAESVLIASAGGWGSWYGGWTGHLAETSPDTHWLITLTVGDIAMLGSAAVLAGPIEADWRDVALVDGMGLLGAATGALVGVIASPDLDAAATGALVGSTLGLGGGIAMAARSGPSAADLVGLPDLNLDLPVHVMVQPMPWQDEEGNPGVWVNLQVVEKDR